MPKQCCKDFWNKLTNDPDDPPAFTLVAYDQLALETAEFWRSRAVALGVNADKLARVDQHIEDMRRFAEEHPERMKVPD